MPGPFSTLLQRARGVYDLLALEVGKFGLIGLGAFVIDTTLYNLVVFGVPGTPGVGPMHDIPLRAKILATAIAMVFAWLGNRYWTFRHRRRSRKSHEFVLFVVFNVLGLAIALACLGFSRYVLGLDSQLADNVSANGIGLVLGTVFRFWAYRTYVFSHVGDAQGAGAMETYSTNTAGDA
ncbi:GtrA family protein [Ornithinimicrobium sediminis]|uniref:GtrA family protein n=1 Tax=Ornithinimicrobium sediminis TaxID=2904603 RepID=UPI001E343FAC|nr:GtrA family protein [Ornithinimicrobium sediminis]MCE0486450.1 GtrA family protein [Ornithinimicrobium sediminis]